VSIAYVVGDVAYEGWKGHLQAKGDPNDNIVIALKVARRAAFQGTASKPCLYMTHYGLSDT